MQHDTPPWSTSGCSHRPHDPPKTPKKNIFSTVKQVLPTIRQLAGIATKDYRRDKRGRGAAQRGAFRGGNYGRGRGSGGRYGGYAEGARGAGGGGSEAGGRGGGAREKEAVLKPKQFDIVFLDPPTWSKSGHGAVDLVRDYQVHGVCYGGSGFYFHGGRQKGGGAGLKGVFSSGLLCLGCVFLCCCFL